MKRNTIFLIAATLLASSGASWATGGRLNKDGCHNSKKAGYHCHRAQSDKGSTKSKAATSSAPGASAASPKK